MVARTSAWVRYNIRVVWLSLIYAAFLILAVYGFKHGMVGGPASYLVAVLPALPIIGIFVAIGRYLVEEQDEYVRMLMVRQTLWASGFTLSLATIWGFLDNFKLVGHIDGYWIVAVWFVGLGIGAIVNKLTLGAAGC
jgi:hypothetical protein